MHRAVVAFKWFGCLRYYNKPFRPLVCCDPMYRQAVWYFIIIDHGYGVSSRIARNGPVFLVVQFDVTGLCRIIAAMKLQNKRMSSQKFADSVRTLVW